MSVIDLVGLTDVASKRVGGFSLGMGQRLGIASALLGDPQTWSSTSRSTGWTPKACSGIRNLLKGLAAEGRTVFVSSHLMSEMALTATTAHRDRARAADRGHHGRGLRGPRREQRRHRAQPRGRPRCVTLLLGADVSVTSDQSGVLQVRGLTAEQIGTTAWQAHLPVFELTTQQASLEEAFMKLTDDSVDFRSHDAVTGRRGRGGGRPMSAVMTPAAPAATAPAVPLKVTQGRVLRSEWLKFRSLRSTVYTLLAAIVLTIGIGALFSAVTASQYHTLSASGKATFSAVSTSLAGSVSPWSPSACWGC